ncbi:hypothetical protein JOM56_014423, partial [Amanita muscaria]
TAPEAKMEHKHGEVYSLYHHNAEDHPVSCHHDASSFSPALASERSNIPIPTLTSEHVGTVDRHNSILPQMTAPERQSGLAPKNQELAQAPGRSRVSWLSDVSPMPTQPPRRRPSPQDRPNDDSQPPSGPASRSSRPEPGASMNHGLGGSPRADMPEDPWWPYYTHETQRNISDTWRAVRTLMHAPLSVQERQSLAQSVPHPPPTRIMSHASDAAMEIEESQKEKVFREREPENQRRP